MGFRNWAWSICLFLAGARPQGSAQARHSTMMQWPVASRVLGPLSQDNLLAPGWTDLDTPPNIPMRSTWHVSQLFVG